ncbi:MAG: flagellar basal body L-ring protein FlgH [Pseudomonadota bacterium]
MIRLRTAVSLLCLGLAVGALPGCRTLERLSEVGDVPQVSPIQNPTLQPGYQPVSLPMPTPIPDQRQPNSLWRAGSRAFFKDQRASRVGDILTVLVAIKDQAKLDNTTNRSRNAGETAALDNLFGYESALSKLFPKDYDPTALVNGNSTSSTVGSGSVDRQEDIQLKVAAVITQVLPNGNMVLQGSQQIRVNAEVRELQVAGIIRPEDITSTNTIDYDKIAEARISYGGRGIISDTQQPRYGQEIYDILFPF